MKYILITISVLLMISTVVACPVDSQHLVKIRVVGFDDNTSPLQGIITIKAHPNEDAAKYWDVISIFGFDFPTYKRFSNPQQEQPQIEVFTSEAVVKMHSTTEYEVTFVNESRNISMSYYVYPMESEYVFVYVNS